EEAVRLAAEQPLTDDEARPLFTRIVAILKGAFDEGVTEEKRVALTTEAKAIVADLLVQRRAKQVQAESSTGRRPAKTSGHVELDSRRGLKIRPVVPVPTFNGQAIAMMEGYIPTENIQLWPENHRLRLHIEAFRQANRRDP